MKVVAEVDVDLGLTRVVWIGAAQDVGKAINPQQVEGQIEGGTAQGLGLALMEEIQTRDGLITNASFTDYLIPTALDMPPVESVLIEDPEPDAPYGVKGVGEPPTVVSTAAIVAALRAATGRELTRVPVRPDDICLSCRDARRCLTPRHAAWRVTSTSSSSSHGTPSSGGGADGRLLAHDRRDRGDDDHRADEQSPRQSLAAEQHAEHDRDHRVHVRVRRDHPERRVREQPDVRGVADDRAETTR